MRSINLALILLLGTLFLSSCNDKPAVRQAYDFSLSSWYLQKSAKAGEEVEIRFYLTRQGDFKDATYRIGYIQMDGEGRVYDTNRRILTSREDYELEIMPGVNRDDPQQWVFTLFYRAGTDKKSELRFYVKDSFGQQRDYDVSFSPNTSKEDE